MRPLTPQVALVVYPPWAASSLSRWNGLTMSEASYYDNPLIGRYASPEMATLWGPQRKFSTWRRLWVALAEAEAELGLPITAGQIAELRAQQDHIDFAKAAQYESKRSRRGATSATAAAAFAASTPEAAAHATAAASAADIEPASMDTHKPGKRASQAASCGISASCADRRSLRLSR